MSALRCPQCSAPIQAHAEKCEYCRTALVYSAAADQMSRASVMMTTSDGVEWNRDVTMVCTTSASTWIYGHGLVRSEPGGIIFVDGPLLGE